MKIYKLILNFVIISFTVTHSNYGQSFCHTVSSLPYTSVIPTISNFGEDEIVPRVLRVYFHVIRRNDSSGGYLPYEVIKSYNVLQTNFTQTKITFAWDGCIDYIDNSTWYSNISGVAQATKINTHSDGIDIYLFPRNYVNNGGIALNTLEFKTRIAIYGTINGEPVPFTSTLAHEMGHILTLKHTHETGSFDGLPGCPEFVDGSNSEICGDRIKDTDADPNMEFNVDVDCQWLGSGNDPNGHSYDPDEHNIMSYSRLICMNFFSDGQIKRMHNNILNFLELAACLVNEPIVQNYCNCPPNDLVFSENIVIDQDFIVTGDIKIINGATLTVKSKIYFKDGKNIDQLQNCKLIVDGGTLTSCDPKWGGIRVTGGNTDFDVKFTNNATIENTAVAAVSMFAPYLWPEIQSYGNGILFADNTTFNNTRRIVEFMSWSPKFNSSYIRNCTQNGGKWSITNWNCQGIEISDNKFYGISEDCIVTESGSFKIIRNDFHSTNNDILFNNVSAGISSIIENNRFNSWNYGYNARGTTFAQNQISNNIFRTGFLGVVNDGHTSYDLFNNKIEGIYGSASYDNGFGIGDVHHNDFTGNIAGIIPIGNNSEFNFYKNCFSTNFFDSYISGQITPVITDESNLAANNCFTHQGSLASFVSDIGGSPNSFTYFEPNDAIVNCRDAIKSPLNIIRSYVQSSPTEICKIDAFGILDTTFNPCFPSKTFVSSLKAYNWLITKINQIQTNTSFSPTLKAQFIAIYQRCLRRVKGILFELYVKDGLYNDARAIYSLDNDDDAKINVFSSYIHENNITAARTYLNNINGSSEEMLDYKIVQNINLDRIPYGPYYQPSAATLTIVRTIALKQHPIAAYAKALYYLLTEEVITTPLPELLRQELNPRSREMNEIKIDVYPNPITNVLNIAIEGSPYGKVEILDLFGKVVYQSTLAINHIIIETEQWQKGLYFVLIYDQGLPIYSNKVMLID